MNIEATFLYGFKLEEHIFFATVNIFFKYNSEHVYT